MAQRISNRQRQVFVLFLLALVAAGKVIQPCLDWDTWWHLRVAQHIVQERQFPEHEPFSQLGQSEKVPWIAYSWLYDLLLYGCFQIDGAAGVLAFRYFLVMMSWGGIAWFLLRHAGNKWLALGLLALISISLRPFSPERPWHFTIFFTTLTLHAVIRVRQGAPAVRFWWLPIVYVLWANIHIQFVMGFAVLGLAWLAALLGESSRVSGRVMESERGSARPLFFLGLACALATLINPYHVRLYAVIYEYATQTQALRLVMELHEPDFTAWYNWPLIVLLAGAIFTTIRRGFRVWDMLMLASAIFFSVRMQRDLWYGVLVASAVILNRKDGCELKDLSSRISARLIITLSTAAVILVSFAWEVGLSKGKTVAISHDETYPVQAARFIREQRLPGPLFNDFDWGGYLIWALPEYPVSIDGRTNFYGEERLLRAFNAWTGYDWKDNPELLRAGVILAPKKRGDKEFGLTHALLADDRWRIVHEDKVAFVFVPNTKP